MRKYSLVIMTAILVFALATVALAAAPHVGTWKQNLVKSKYSPGPPPKNQMLTITAQDNGIKSVMDYVDANGKASHIVFAAKFDGKDYPITGDPGADSISYTRIDANTLGFVIKKGGKETEKGREFFSKDGKTWTWVNKGKDDKGQDFNYTAVFDKQ
jgi:hypothetical protein